MSDLELTLLHVVGGAHIGYGRMGVYIAKEMREKGVTVYDSIADSPDDRSGSTRAIEVWGERTPGITNVIAWASVPTHARGWWEGQVPVMMTMWESMKLPESFRENLHEFDTIIVPSRQNQELFSDHHPNVKYVPLGVDPERWHFRQRKEGPRFNFMCAGSGARKGTDLAVKAFRSAFPEGSWGDGPVPYMILKQNKPEDLYGNRIERVTGRMSGEAEANLYGEAHCYVQPSRGEGFGLQPLQAIAQGIPTILTDAHGHEAFAHLGMGIGSTPVVAGYFIYGDAGDWWEPNLDELVDTMRYVYFNYDEAKERATEASYVARKEFTWSKTAEAFMDAIGKERLGPYTGPKKWYKPTAKMYRTITNCNHTADIGGTIHFFEEGVEQYCPADVKRVLFDAGKLDPACLIYTGEDDEGLHPEQVARIPEYVRRSQYCPSCHQKIGSGTTVSDQIMSGELDADTVEVTD